MYLNLGCVDQKNTKTLLSCTHASASFKFIWWEGKENTNQVKVLWIKFFTNEQLQKPHEAKVYIHCKYKSYHSRVILFLIICIIKEPEFRPYESTKFMWVAVAAKYAALTTDFLFGIPVWRDCTLQG